MDLLNGPTEEQLKIIKENLNEDEDRFENNLSLLKSWISCQDYLPKNCDTRILAIFLRGCKHDLEKTKRKLQYYFSVKQTSPELYSNRDTTSNDFLTASKIMAIIPLKDLNDDGTRILACKLMSTESYLFNIIDIVRLFLMMGDIRVSEEHPIAGDVIIMDCGKNMTAIHIAKCLNFVVGKGVAIANEAYPQRVKKIHVLNLPDFGDKFLNFLKSFMKEKMRNRFIIHRKPENLTEYINPKILPIEYGGYNESLLTMHEKWQRYLIEKKDWFKEQEKLTTLEPIPKHILQSCALDSNEHLQGSFRKLAID